MLHVIVGEISSVVGEMSVEAVPYLLHACKVVSHNSKTAKQLPHKQHPKDLYSHDHVNYITPPSSHSDRMFKT